jgi:predicted hotdog family 3-hydroxylacyl-ACP dehydratase
MPAVASLHNFPFGIQRALLYYFFFKLSISFIATGLAVLEIDLDTLLPHRGRMKLLDKVLEVDDHSAVSKAIVADEWPMTANGTADALVLVELAAQTSAVCIGWKELKKDLGSRLEGRGWLVGIKEAFFYLDRIAVDAEIITRTNINFTLENYTEIQAQSESGGDVIAQIVLQVLRDEDKKDSV